MYVLIGKEKCNQCNILKNLLDEKGIQYHDVNVSKWCSLVGFVSGFFVLIKYKKKSKLLSSLIIS